MKAKCLQPTDDSIAAELDQLEHHHSLDDAAGATYERVVWRRGSTIKLNRLDQVGLADSSAQYPSFRAVHVGDAEGWFEKLIDDYGRARTAWIIEITPVEGDRITDDPQYVLPETSGSRLESKILITSRTVLHEDEDFTYVRELDASDLSSEIEDDGNEEYGYGGGYDDDGYGNDDE